MPTAHTPRRSAQIFTGTLDGWPALTNLELRSITLHARSLVGVDIRQLWHAGEYVTEPAFPDDSKVTDVRVTLRAPPWSAIGYSAESPGYVFWSRCAASRPGNLRIFHGEHYILESFSADRTAPARAVRVHHFVYRYPKTWGMFTLLKDMMWWHTAVLIEWDHGLHTTVAEMGYIQGSGWSAPHCDYYDDSHWRAALFDSRPMCLVGPWRADRVETRLCDVAAKDLGQLRPLPIPHHVNILGL